MSTELLREGVHVVGGNSGAATLSKVLGGDEQILIHGDVLSCGPLPAASSVEEWEDVRGGFIAEMCAPFARIAARPLSVGPRALLAHLNRLRDPDVFVWAATGIDDQLLIAFVADLVQRIGGDQRRVHRIQFIESTRGWRYLTTGELSEEAMLAHPSPERLTDSLLDEYIQLWSAVTATTPLELQRIGGQATRTAENLGSHAARRLMTHWYPYEGTGLNRWESLLLRNVQYRSERSTTPPRAILAVGDAMRDVRVDCVGDAHLLWRLCRMASDAHPKPLIELGGDLGDRRTVTAILTGFGRQVAAGQASAYPVNPIEDWIGGVHLSSRSGGVWMLASGSDDRPCLRWVETGE